MRIAVLSDTHGKLAPTGLALEQIRQREVELIIHCGDIGCAELIPLFADWPTHFVFGNVDYDGAYLTAKIEEAGQHAHGTFGELHLADKRIAFLHGHDSNRLRDTITSGDWDLVCYGHTHKKETHIAGNTIVLNPGALYRARPRTFALVDLPTLEVEFLIVPQ